MKPSFVSEKMEVLDQEDRQVLPAKYQSEK
jgi:hypothetical protein